jgi:spore maturation protein CgeB
MKTTTIAIHGTKSKGKDGGAYNSISAFADGLFKGFKKIDTVKAVAAQKNVPFELAIGFNAAGADVWPQILKEKIPNIMWGTDSAFLHNFETIKKFSSDPNFILFEVTPSDKAALDYFFPHLQHTYMPHAVDLELWKYKKTSAGKKEHDIVFLGSISDWEEDLLKIKKKVTPKRFQLVMEMFNSLLKNPLVNFFDAFKIYREPFEVPFEADGYAQLFKEVMFPLQQAQRTLMVAALQGFNVKVFGEGPWEKYLGKNQQYMGSVDMMESVDIIRKSKIVLHCHPPQLGISLHERVLNASAVETFVLSSQNPVIESEFGNSVGYFDHSHFQDIAGVADYYLKNEDEAREKAKNARLITEENHSFKHRAESILAMLQGS